MAKKINLPIPYARGSLARIDPDGGELSATYPRTPLLPRPSNWNFVNERNARKIRGYTEVIDASNKLVDSLSEHQRVLARLDNVGREIFYDRLVVEFNISRLLKKQRELLEESPPKNSQKPPASLATMFGEEIDDDE